MLGDPPLNRLAAYALHALYIIRNLDIHGCLSRHFPSRHAAITRERRRVEPSIAAGFMNAARQGSSNWAVTGLWIVVASETGAAISAMSGGFASDSKRCPGGDNPVKSRQIATF